MISKHPILRLWWWLMIIVLRSIVHVFLLLLHLLLDIDLFGLLLNIGTEEPLHPFNVGVIKYSSPIAMLIGDLSWSAVVVAATNINLG